MNLIDEFPIRQQRNKDDCSVCVIWCVLRYFNIEISYREIYKFVDPPSDPNIGVTGEQIKEILKKFQIKAIYEKSSISNLRLYTNNNLPVIASIQYRKERNKKWKDTQKYGHYIIVLRVKKGRIKYMDPNYGTIHTLTTKDFKKRWHDGDEFPAIICYTKNEI
jgi:ABC-type bacteriocin/lantibiotic exporter with double-glycine peptidase domain